VAVPVIIKGENGSRVQIDVRGYERAAGSDPHDNNWLGSTLLVEVAGFRGELGVALQTFDFSRFGRELGALLDAKARVASFETMEEGISLRVEAERHGHATISGTVRSESAKFSFSFETDQTYLRAVLREVRVLMSEFPER
jgi:hypothetical protein